MEELLIEAVRRVNKTLKYYEKDYIEAKRTPYVDREVCKSFQQYIEIRFNMECYNSLDPLLSKLEKDFGGFLFKCISLKDSDERKRRFKEATMSLIDIKEVINPDENLKNELEELKSKMGGSKITFNSVKCKVILKINE